MARLRICPVLAIVAALTACTTAWGINFYTGENCQEDSTYNNANYRGEGKGDCLAAGAPGDNCVWYYDNVRFHDACTGPMEPQPGSFMFNRGSYCLLGAGDRDCFANQLFYSEEGGKCHRVADLYNAGSQLHFQCADVGDKAA